MSTEDHKFLDAIVMQDLSKVTALLREGQDANVRENLPWEHGETALMLAVQFDKTGEIVRALLDYGANVNARDKRCGRTSLMYKVHPLLIERGADVNAHDEEGRSVLQWAVERGDVKEVEMLLKHGVEVKGTEGVRAIETAQRYGFTAIAELVEASHH